MGARADLITEDAMRTRWRRRQMCVLSFGGPHPASLRTVSASGAFLETNAKPGLGQSVELHHPEAGAIGATVDALHADGIVLRFDGSEAAVAFAMSAIVADMSRPD